MSLEFFKADVTDAEILSQIAMESKQFWGYSNEQMQMWQDELTISADYILKNEVVKCYDSNELVGFFAIVDENGIIEIDHLWLKPNQLRKGFGKIIFEEIRKMLSKKNKTNFQLVAEPNAIGFYAKMGGKPVGSFESKI